MWDLPMSCNYFLDPNFLGKAWSLSEPIFYLLSLSSKFTFCFLLYEVGSVSLKQFSFASTMLSFVNRDYQEDIARRVFPTSANALIRLAPAAHTASLTTSLQVASTLSDTFSTWSSAVPRNRQLPLGCTLPGEFCSRVSLAFSSTLRASSREQIPSQFSQQASQLLCSSVSHHPALSDNFWI